MRSVPCCQAGSDHWYLGTSLVCLLILTGCGGTKPAPVSGKPAAVATNPAPANAGQANAPAAVGNEPAVAAAAQPGGGAPRRGRKKAGVQSSESDSLELAAGEQLFAVMGDPVPPGRNYRIDNAADKDRGDRFAVAALPPKIDSSMFTMLPATTGAGASNAGNAASASGATPAADTGHYELPNAGFSPVPGAGVDAEGLPFRLRCERDDSIMALVPAGVFLQGNDAGPSNARPQHEVFLDAFYIDITEVSSDQYENYRQAQMQEKKRVAAPTRTAADPQEPVLGINWGEAQMYAHWAGKELPTEAQWEKAARGPTGFNFPWGNGRYLWHKPRTQGQIEKVGVYQGDRSPYGVLDLAGNAREWCLDWYVEKAYSQLLDAGDSTPRNPSGPKLSGGAKQRVVKGGDAGWRVWGRTGLPLTERQPDVGFRCILPLKFIPPESQETGRGKKSTKPKAARS